MEGRTEKDWRKGRLTELVRVFAWSARSSRLRAPMTRFQHEQSLPMPGNPGLESNWACRSFSWDLALYCRLQRDALRVRFQVIRH